MSDPTHSVLSICLIVALGFFVAGSLWKAMRGRKVAAPVPLPAASEAGATEDPYRAPAGPLPLPPPLPERGVSTWPYRPIDLLWMGFLFLTFSGLALSLAAAPAEEPRLPAVADLIVSIGFQLILAGATVGVIAWRVNPVTWLGLAWRQWPWVLLIAPATVVTMWVVFASIAALGYMEWIESLGVDPVQDAVKLLQSADDPALLATMVVAAVLVAPVCEEIIFRGYLYPAAKKFAGPWIAGFSISVVFAVAHGNLASALPLFLFGIVLVVLYEKTRSIWTPIAAHLCFNGATVIVQAAARYYNIPLEP